MFSHVSFNLIFFVIIHITLELILPKWKLGLECRGILVSNLTSVFVLGMFNGRRVKGSGGKYGCSWQVDQLKIVSKPMGLVGYAFRDDVEDED